MYEPTKAALEAIRPRMVKGSIIAFDELTDEEYPGETLAARDVLGGFAGARLVRSKYLPSRAYMVVD